MKTYDPKPGSTPYRAIAHLGTINGAEISTAALAEAIGAPPSAMRACLGAAVEHGALFCRQKGGAPNSPVFWSISDRCAEASVAPVARLLPECAEKALTACTNESCGGVRCEERCLLMSSDPDPDADADADARGVQDEQPSQFAPDHPHREFHCALFSDGRLMFEFDGTPILTLSAEQTGTLCRYLDRIAQENAS